MAEITRTLTLNRDEVMVLADRTQNTDVGTDDMRVVAYRLLFKLGSLYLELVDPADHTVRSGDIRVTEAEAWLLRSKVQSGDKMASDPLFGVRLLRKIYQVLVEFEAAVDMPLAESDGPAMGSGQREALSLWAKQEGEADEGLQPAA